MNKTKAILCRIIPAACCLALLLPVVGLADTNTGLALSPEFRRALFYSQNNEVSADQDADRPGFGKRAFRDLSSAVKITLSDVKHIYTAPARMDVGHALWLGGILAVGGVIFAYDQEIYDALKRNEDHKYYKPIRAVGEFFEPLGYMGFTNKFLFAALAIGYVTRIEPMVAIPRDVLEHFLVASFGKNTMMVLAGRKGPMMGKGPRSRAFNDGRSFPSGHSLAITQLASVLSHHTDYVPLKVVAYGMAGTVLLQRITSDHHWPSDVYGGAVFGWMVSRELLKRKERRRIRVTPVAWDGEKGAGMIVTFGF